MAYCADWRWDPTPNYISPLSAVRQRRRLLDREDVVREALAKVAEAFPAAGGIERRFCATMSLVNSSRPKARMGQGSASVERRGAVDDPPHKSEKYDTALTNC